MTGRTIEWARIRIVVIACVMLAGGCGPGAPAVTGPDTHQQDRVNAAEQLLRQAVQAEQAGQPNIAEKKYTRALRLRPVHYRTNARFTQFLIASERAAEAIPIATAYRSRRGNDPKAHHLVIDALLAAGEFEDAIDAATQLLTMGGSDAAALEKRGRARGHVGRYDDATRDLRRAIELDASAIAPRLSLAWVFLSAGDPALAAQQLETIARTAPDNVRAMILLGTARRALGQFEPALQWHAKAVQHDPDSGPARFELGVTQTTTRDYLAACASLGEAVKLAPNRIDYWFSYAEALRLAKRNPEAAAAYERVMQIEPGHTLAATAKTRLGILRR